MTDDIVTRLREAGDCPTPLRAYLARAVVLQAADEIERLRSTVTDRCIEIERLRAERDEANSTAPTPANTGGGADHQIPEAL
jgi:hypothetical protein